MSDNLKQILLHSFRSGVSDIFLTAGKSPAWRLWGEIKFRYDFPRVTAAELEEFRSSQLDPEREARYQRTGATDAALVLTPELRVRCNFYATASGPAVAIRPIRPASELNFAALNLPDRLSELCLCRRGMILISGATGCGKSTTLAAMIDRINRTRSCHILTLEDPIEYIQSDDLALISQREVSPEIGFAAAIRDAVRENPDVIVIGEMRDLDTVQAAISAALTGHLVIATIHAQDTVQAVERLLNLYPPPLRDQAAADLGLALTAILCQRLIPRADKRGMIPAVEILLNTPTVSKSVAARNFGGMEDALRQGAADGMQTFTRAVFQLLRNGRIAQADAKNNVGNPAELELLLKGMDRGVEAFGRQNGDATAADTPAEDMRFLLLAALDNRASDLHLTLDSPPIFRIGGQLRQVEMPPLNGEDIQHLLYSVITSRQRVELEEKRELDFALSVRMRDDGDAVARFRLNAFFQRGALGVVARVIHTEIPSPEELSLPPTLLKLSDKGQGLILVTGPTGSGKSTTLACLLDQINRRRHVKIITIEDPIEYVHTNRRAVVEQRELHSDTKSFASALKSALRQDPDVIMVGEMRDLETISAALTAAETGHLVFATIHTNSAPQTVDRIVDSFPSHQQNQIRQQLAEVLLGVVSQRLLPKADGDGMIAAFEIMIGTPPVRSLIRENKTYQLQSVMETGSKDGMVTLDKYMEDLCSRRLVLLESTKAFRPDFHLPESF